MSVSKQFASISHHTNYIVCFDIAVNDIFHIVHMSCKSIFCCWSNSFSFFKKNKQTTATLYTGIICIQCIRWMRTPFIRLICIMGMLCVQTKTPLPKSNTKKSNKNQNARSFFYQMKWKLWNFCFCSSWVYLFCVDRGTIEIDGKIIPYQNEWFNCCVNIIYSYASVCVLISLYLLLWDLFPIFIISHLKLYEVKATV